MGKMFLGERLLAFVPDSGAAAAGSAEGAGAKAAEGSEAVMRLDLGEKLAPKANYKFEDCYFWQTH